MKLVFDDACKYAFNELKKRPTLALIAQPPNKNLFFKIMYDASDFIIGVVLGQKVDCNLHVISYATHTFDEA